MASNDMKYGKLAEVSSDRHMKNISPVQIYLPGQFHKLLIVIIIST